MTVQDYLLKFRKISSLESLEKLFDHLNYTLTDDSDMINMYRAADHRRAELISGGRLFDVGQVPKEGANKRGNSSRLTQSFHFFMFEPIFSPVNALNQPI